VLIDIRVIEKRWTGLHPDPIRRSGFPAFSLPITDRDPAQDVDHIKGLAKANRLQEHVTASTSNAVEPLQTGDTLKIPALIEASNLRPRKCHRSD